MRREFELPEEDQEFLSTYPGSWETIREGNHQWLILHNYEIISGYNTKAVSVALRIDPGYPNSQIDMAYFSPALVRADRQPISALANQVIDGKNYQRWSRHRTGQNPWRPGVDNLQAHLLLMNYWLEREFTLR